MMPNFKQFCLWASLRDSVLGHNFPDLPEQQDQKSGIVTVLPIREVSTSPVLSYLIPNETGNAEL